MTNKELLLIAELLEYAADAFSNASCNDYSLPDWSTEETHALYKEYCKYEGFWEEEDDDTLPGDYQLMRLFAKKIRKETEAL